MPCWLQCSSWSWKTTGCTNLHKLIFIVNPRWRRCPMRITTWCTKIAPPFALIGRFLQLHAQNNADESPKKPKGSRKMTGRWGKTTGRCALSFRPSENPGLATMMLCDLDFMMSCSAWVVSRTEAASYVFWKWYPWEAYQKFWLQKRCWYYYY